MAAPPCLLKRDAKIKMSAIITTELDTIRNFLILKLQLYVDNLRSSENTRETRQKEGEKGERVDDGPMTCGFYDGC